MPRRAWRNLAAVRARLRTTVAPAVVARCTPDERVARQTGSFDDDQRDLLKLFAHRGIIAAGQGRLVVAKPVETSSRSVSFQLNQGLFDRSHH